MKFHIQNQPTDSFFFHHYRSRRPRLSASASVPSRRRWTPSVPRTRLFASAGRSVSRPSALLSRLRSKSLQNPIPLCDVFLMFGGGAEVESGSLLGWFRDSAPAKFFVPPRILGRPFYFSTLPIVGLFFPRISLATRGAFGLEIGNVGAIGRYDDVILKLFLSITRKQKETTFFSQNKKTKNFPHRHGACVLRNVIVSLSQYPRSSLQLDP